MKQGLRLAFIFLLFSSSSLFAQTPGQIYQAATPATNVMDPNGDGYVSVNGTGYSTGQEDNELNFVAIPQYEPEPDADPATGGGCGSTDVIDNPSTGADASYVYFDDPDGISDNGDEVLVYRLRLSKDATGAFGFSVLVDTDGKFGFTGTDADPNAVAGNPGFEYEIRYQTGGGGAGIKVDDVDGGTSATNLVTYTEAEASQRSYARFNDANCTGTAVFYDFFIPISDLGISTTTAIRLAAATSSSPANSILSNISDIAGTDDATFPVTDSAWVNLIELQGEGTPPGEFENGCFQVGNSDAPSITSPIFDSQTTISGTSTEPDGAVIIVYNNNEALDTTTVSSGAWSITIAQGSLRPFDEIMATAEDSCENVSAESTILNVVNDLDSDNDGIPDTEEGNGIDPGDDADGDDTPNYLDTDYVGFVDSNGDGINDNFDTDLDGIPNHFDADSDGDGIYDLVESGGTDSDNDGAVDSQTDADNDGYDDTLEASPLTIDDMDGDGLPNFLDLDADGDGILDSVESANGDTDADGIDDYLDIDSDNDGIPDNVEAQSAASYVAPSGNDTDGDGIDDSYDSDNGGTPLTPVNSDGAGNPDYIDTDSDGDGISDLIEGNDANQDGVADATLTGVDSDGDGLDDAFDTGTYGTTGNATGSNVALQDTDSNGTPNYQDNDDDGDGIDTATEGTGFTQGGSPTPDYLYDPDHDGDGVNDNVDLDSDNDGILDANEDGGTGFDPTGDADGDGTLNYLDQSDATSGFPAFVDANGDNINDAYDQDLDGIPDFQDLDSDDDGIVDLVEAGGTDSDGDGVIDSFSDGDNDGLHDALAPGGLTPSDTDADGLVDYLDIDSDNDGLVDNLEAQAFAGYTAPTGSDSDGDGIDDAYDPDSGGTALNPVDTDTDLTPDYLDSDSDEDGVNDIIEGHDANLDGVGDWDDNGNGVVDGSEGTGDADGDGLLDAFDNVSGTGTSGNSTGSNASVQDSDGDGTANYQDTDDDGDGALTSAEGGGYTQGGEPIPDYLYNPDYDGDGVNDNLDADSDNDGVPDSEEDGGTGFDPTADGDGDGILNYLDTDNSSFGGPSFVDGNGDGINDLYDLDLDGIPDFRDRDADNDGVTDLVEAGGTDSDNNGILDDLTDTDGDGTVDLIDPDNGGTPLSVPDTDGDGVADFFDVDSDNDGISDLVENGQTDSDGDGRLDSPTDSDKDGIADTFDTDAGGSPLTELDTDGDGVPNTADGDSDGDGISDLLEAGGTDSDGDGKLDSFTDSDGDGFDDSVDADSGGTALSNPDTDADGIPNTRDSDSDGDGITDLVEGQSSASYVAPSGSDTDGDGIDDSYDPDNGGIAITPVDTDGKGDGDYIDSDSDGDGISDLIEGNDANNDGVADTSLSGSDSDGDGIDDNFDPDSGGSAAALQDLDGDSIPDFRDTDDDGDGIPTIDETLDISPANGVKDYLEDGLGSCGLGFVTEDFVGNADAVTSTTGTVSSIAKALGSGDDTPAILEDVGTSVIILDLTETIPTGETIVVRLASSLARTVNLQVTGSSDNVTYSDLNTFSPTNTTYTNYSYTVAQANGVRYLRIFYASKSGGSPQAYVDALSYSYTVCSSDYDNDGIADEEDNDDDNDGIPDTTESPSGADPSADDDGDGVANYEDANYAGFVDSNGDGINDNFDADLDGIPNHFDLDSDNDGIPDAVEANEGTLPANMTDDGRFTISYVQVNDFDDDGLANVYDTSDGGTALTNPNTDGDANADFLDSDADGDGQPDYIEGFDDDGSGDALNDYITRAAAFESASGNPGYYTTDDTNGTDDGDGIPDWLEDDDLNGIPNFLDPGSSYYQDSDNDGIVDLFDTNALGSQPYASADSDGDGTPDYLQNTTLVTLPVELLYFRAIEVEGEPRLVWATAAEENNDYFLLQRSTDGRHFTTIQQVAGAGTTQTLQQYGYTDHQAPQAKLWYRLVQVDYDGQSEDLGTVSISLRQWQAPEALTAHVYPNPAISGGTLTLSIEGKALQALRLTDLQGRTVWSFPAALLNVGPLPLPQLPDGMYLLNGYTTEGQRITATILIRQ